MPSVTNQLSTPPAAGPGTRQRRAAELRAKREGRAAAARSADSPIAAAVPSAAEVAPDQMGERQRKAMELRAKAKGREMPATAPVGPGSPAPVPGERQRRAAELRAERDEAPAAVDEARQRDDAGEAARDEIQDCGPVGDGEHLVRQGECISSIAKDAGHFWETIWNDPANTDLRHAHRNPNVLLPDDRVHVPELRRKQVPRPSEQRHRFTRRGEPVSLRIRVVPSLRPIHGRTRGYGRPVPYKLVLGDRIIEDFATADGMICVATVDPRVRHGELTIQGRTFLVKIGHLDPATTTTGIQGRLRQMGYYRGEVDGIIGRLSRAALRDFQRLNQLRVTGNADPETIAKLEAVHKS